jgi:hypothetical protein
MNITSDSINRELLNLCGRKRVKPKAIKDRLMISWPHIPKRSNGLRIMTNS